MRVEYINPFIASVYSTFQTMLSCAVTRGDLAVSDQAVCSGDITAIIGLSGPARGTVALSFPFATAHALVARLLQVDTADAKDSIPDGVAELVNIVAGSAKAKFTSSNGGGVINLGLPTVVQGREYVINYPKETTWLDVSFNSDLGPFTLRVTFELQAKEGEKR